MVSFASFAFPARIAPAVSCPAFIRSATTGKSPRRSPAKKKSNRPVLSKQARTSLSRAVVIEEIHGDLSVDWMEPTTETASSAREEPLAQSQSPARPDTTLSSSIYGEELPPTTAASPIDSKQGKKRRRASILHKLGPAMRISNYGHAAPVSLFPTIQQKY